MKWFWLGVVLLAAVGAWVWWSAPGQAPGPVPGQADHPPALAEPTAAPEAAPMPEPEPVPAAPRPPSPEPSPSLPAAPAPAPVAPVAPAPPAAPAPPTTITRIDARTIRVADRFEIVGNGTERDPYRITWEYLQSAQAGWSPKKGKDALASHVLLLDGAWVEIDGYWAPAVVVDETKEVLVMLNRWDGCCLGVPPTPFDSIEVSLAAPVAIGVQHSFRFGTLRGRLEVSPFNLGDLVLGLYRLHDASISSS